MQNAINILLIEDNENDAFCIREMLEENIHDSYRIRWVQRLKDGIGELKKGDIDVVLLDLTLPDSRGIFSVSRLKEVAGFLPVIVLTGVDDDELGLKAIRTGAHDYVSKQYINAHTIRHSIRYAIERQKLMSSIKVLAGLLPICINCKKIRDDRGYWEQVEEYIRKHSEADFSHSFCPDCFRRLYPSIADKKV